MNLGGSLVLHLLYEFGNAYHKSKKVLAETRGVVTGLGEVVSFLAESMSGQIKDSIENKTEIIQTYAGKLPDNVSSGFFIEYEIEFTACYNTKNSKPTYSGGLITKLSFSEDYDGALICKPFIRLKIAGNSLEKIKNTLLFCLGHEFTHAYDLYQYAVKNNLGSEEIMDNVLIQQNYSNILNGYRNGKNAKEKGVSNLLYSLNRMERNAYIAQLKQEIETRKNEIHDSSSALKVIKSTSSYGRLNAIEQNVEALFAPHLTRESKEEILSYTNRLTGKNFTNFAQIQKYYLRRWEKWKKKYLSTASKIVYDIYSMNKKRQKDDNFVILDDDMFDDSDILLKP